MSVPVAFPESSQATSALIWSIVGLVCCGVAAIVGWVQAQGELQAISDGRRDPVNRGTASAARIISIIGVTLWLLSFLALAALIATGAGLGIFDRISELSRA